MEHHNEFPGDVPSGIHIGCAQQRQGSAQQARFNFKNMVSGSRFVARKYTPLQAQPTPTSKVAPGRPQNRVSKRSMMRRGGAMIPGRLLSTALFRLFTTKLNRCPFGAV